MPDDELTRLRALLAEATPGPWEAQPETDAGNVWVRRAGQRSTLPEYVAEPLFRMRESEPTRDAEFARRVADAALIVELRNHADALLDRVERAEHDRDGWKRTARKLESERDQLRAEVERLRAVLTPTGEAESLARA